MTVSVGRSGSYGDGPLSSSLALCGCGFYGLSFLAHYGRWGPRYHHHHHHHCPSTLSPSAQAPGEYDWDYIHYVQKLVEKAATYGITVFLDPHQDVWSRSTGGDGAPLWTLDMVGLDADLFKDTLAAYCHEHEPEKYCEMLCGEGFLVSGSRGFWSGKTCWAYVLRGVPVFRENDILILVPQFGFGVVSCASWILRMRRMVAEVRPCGAATSIALRL